MCFLEILSDQLYTWSDENRKRTCCQSEEAPPSTVAPVAAAQGSPARLAYRALQALRKARVQLAQVAEFIANHHRAREILRAISETNRELLRRREVL